MSKREESITAKSEPKQPAHCRGKLLIGEIEISPAQFLKDNPEAFRELYRQYVWKLKTSSSRIDIYNNVLDMMEEAAVVQNTLLEEDELFKNAIIRRPRNAYASAKIALRLCSPEEKAELLMQIGEL